MLASGVSKRCLEAGQRLRVQVTDPSLTATLRSELNPKTKENHWSLAMAMAEIVDADWLGITTDAQADRILQHLWCVEPHASSTPNSCADWIPQETNSAKLCLAWVKTDIGFVLRKRPTPDLKRSEEYYKEALDAVPGYCPAESYLTELYVQQVGSVGSADAAAKAREQFVKACKSCGKNSLDILDVKAAFAAQDGVDVPCGTPCTTACLSSEKNRAQNKMMSMGTAATKHSSALWVATVAASSAAWVVTKM